MKERVNSLLKYLEVYQCIGAGTLSKKELQEKLKQTMAKTTLEGRIKDVRAGKAEMVLGMGEQYKVDYAVLRSFIEQLCKELGTDATVLFSGPAPAGKGRGDQESTYAMVENVQESQQSKAFKAEISKLKKQIRELEEAQIKDIDKICDSFVASMDRKLFIPSTAVGFGKAFEEDLFLHLPEQLIGEEESLIHTGGEASSCYEEKGREKRDFTVKNMWNSVVTRLMHSKFFQQLYEDEQKADQKLSSERLMDKKQISQEDIRKNREKAIQELLDANISNQVKLSLYAGMYEYHGTELEDLLNFAGDKGLEANYVIRLLERPDDYNNYENVRGFLRQACKSSEAKMKRIAAMELIADEWYVMAMYNGKPCKFQMIPVDELLEFRNVLSKHLYPRALFQLDKMLGGCRKATFVDGDPDKDIVVKDIGTKAIDDVFYAEAAKRLHQFELPRGVKLDAGIQAELDHDFIDYREDNDGKQ